MNLSDQAKAHVQHLVSQGASQASIARAAGINPGTISYALVRDTGLYKKTAMKVLAVKLEDTRGSQSGINGHLRALDEDIERAARHVEMLTGRDVPRRVIADKAGLGVHTISDLFTRRHRTSVDSVQRILAVTWDRVADHAVIPAGDRVREEYPFMRSLLGHEGAVRRLMDAYSTTESAIHYYLAKEAA